MNWKNITLNQFSKLVLAENNLDIIAAISGEDPKDFNLAELNSWLDKIKFLDTAYKPSSPKKEYIINGVSYAPVIDMRKILVNQFVDFQEFIKQPEKNIANIAAIIFIRKNLKYGDKDPLEEAIFLGKYLSIADYKDVFNFFCKAWEKYITSTQASLERILKKSLRKTKDKVQRITLLRGLIVIHLLGLNT